MKIEGTTYGISATAALLASLCVACGAKPSPAEPEWTQHHVQPRAEHRAGRRDVPPLSREQARAALSSTIAAGNLPQLIVFANRLVAKGGVVSRAERDAAMVAIDTTSATRLAALWSELDPVWPAAPTALRVALVARHRGQNEKALTWVARARIADVTGEFAARIATLQRTLRVSQPIVERRVAVLLPLTGPFAGLGGELHDAIALAATRGAVEFVFVDTKGQPAGARIAVDKAVLELHAALLLGPVGALESAAAASRAVELGVPIALLAPASHGAAPDVGIFRLWSSPVWEAREAVRVAVGLGYDKLAILAPRDEQGGAQIEAFREAAREASVQLVAVGTYDPTATNLQGDIKRFLGLDPKSNARLRRHLRRRGVKQGWKTFSPHVPFELLFIPDDYRHAALVAAYLPYFNVELRDQDIMDIPYLKRKHGGRVPRLVQLLGSSGWHHPGLIPRGGKLLEGAMFIDSFAGGNDEEFSTEAGAMFSESFQNAYGRSASPIAAQAYDAASLARSALNSLPEGTYSRAGMRRALSAARLVDGVCGPAAVARTGEIFRDAVVLRIDGGQFSVQAR